MTEPVVIGDSNKWVKDATSKAICLNIYTSSAIGAQSLHDTNNGTNSYICPVGKKAVLLHVVSNFKAGAGNLDSGQNLYQGATENSIVGATQIMQDYAGSTTDGWTSSTPLYCEVSAGNYVTTDPNGAAIVMSMTIIGVEVDV